jgi:hypothetical protein
MISGAWSGLPVAYLFFASVLTYAYVLSVNLWLRHRSKTALAIIAITCSVYFSIIVFGGRRQPTAEFFLMPAVTIWFIRRKAAPRVAAIIGILGMVMFLPSTGDYRSAADLVKHHGGWSRLREIAYLGNLEHTLRVGGHDFTNAALRIEAVDRSASFDFGLSFYNALIASYVPRQVLGQEFKQSLMVPLPDPEFEIFGYVSWTGSTWTGFATAFASLWYFGCLLFFLFAWSMGWLYSRANQGDLMSQVLYAAMLVQSAMVVTHSTVAFVTQWPHMVFFLLSGLYWARKGRPLRGLRVRAANRTGTLAFD